MVLRKKNNYTEYDETTRRFIHLWNSHKTIKQISQNTGLSRSSIKKKRKKLNLLSKEDPKHPHNKETDKRIRRLYYRGFTCKSIAREVHLRPEAVRLHLIKLRIPRRKRNNRNILYNKYTDHSGLSPKKLRTTIKEMYEKHASIRQISRTLHISCSSVRNRLTAMNIEITCFKQKVYKQPLVEEETANIEKHD